MSRRRYQAATIPSETTAAKLDRLALEYSMQRPDLDDRVDLLLGSTPRSERIYDAVDLAIEAIVLVAHLAPSESVIDLIASRLDFYRFTAAQQRRQHQENTE